MRHTARLAALLLGLAAIPQVAAPGTLSIIGADRWARVASVIDGDTFRTVDGDKVRLLGINAPEVMRGNKAGQPLGKAATRTLRGLIGGAIVRLSFDVQQRDDYGRLLAQVYRRDGLWVNGEMVRRGMALAYPFVPNLQEAGRLLALEKEARKARIGIWNTRRFAVLDAKRVSPAHVGQFRVIEGRIARLFRNGAGFRMARLSVTIPRKFRRWFRLPLPVRTGQPVTVHGVVRAGRGGSLYLALHSPYDLEMQP